MKDILSKVKIPKNSEQVPLITLMIEIGFTSSIESELLPGMIKSKMKDRIGTVSAIPLAANRQQTDKKVQSFQLFINNPAFSQLVWIVSSRSFILGFTFDPTHDTHLYTGWNAIKKELSAMTQCLTDLNITKAFRTVSLKNMFFFQDKDLIADSNIDFGLTISSNNILEKTTRSTISTELKIDTVLARIDIATNRPISLTKDNIQTGSILDMRTHLPMMNPEHKPLEEIANLHALSQQLYFAIVKQ